MLTLRQPLAGDSHAAVGVVQRSIQQSCIDDHHGDAATLDKWLANKTPRNFETWISSSENFCVVADANGVLSGVGLLHRDGDVRLFYVDPPAQRLGIGKRIHMALEVQARIWKLARLHLESTGPGASFLRSARLCAVRCAHASFGMLWCYPYEKVVDAK